MTQLKRPSVKLVASYLEFVEEMRALGEKIWDSNIPAPTESHQQFVERLLRGETQAEPGKVTETIYWGVESNVVIGKIGFRHSLNENLKEFGGHIGYEVRPSARNRGHAKEML